MSNKKKAKLQSKKNSVAKNIADAAKENNKNIKVLYFETKEEFENKMDDILKENDSILVKASNGMKFKTIVEKLS